MPRKKKSKKSAIIEANIVDAAELKWDTHCEQCKKRYSAGDKILEILRVITHESGGVSFDYEYYCNDTCYVAYKL